MGRDGDITILSSLLSWMLKYSLRRAKNESEESKTVTIIKAKNSAKI